MGSNEAHTEGCVKNRLTGLEADWSRVISAQARRKDLKTAKKDAAGTQGLMR